MTDTLPRWSVYVGHSSIGDKVYVPVLLHVHAPVEDVVTRGASAGHATYVYVSTDSVREAIGTAARVTKG